MILKAHDKLAVTLESDGVLRSSIKTVPKPHPWYSKDISLCPYS